MDAALRIRISADVAQAVADLNRVGEAAARSAEALPAVPDVEVAVTADTADAETALAALPAVPDVEVAVTADTADAETALAALPAVPDVEVAVTADTADAETALADLSDKSDLSDMTFSVGADTAPAQASLSGIPAPADRTFTVSAETAGAAGALESLGGRIARVAGSGKTFVAVASLKALQAAARAAVNALKEVAAACGSAASAGASWLAAKAAQAAKWAFVAAGAAASAAAAAVVKFGARAEQTRLAFQTMLGSVRQGDAMMAKLDRFSNSTPYSGDQVNQAAKTLLAFGVAAGNVEKSLRMIGDVASGTGKDFGELSAIYGKVFAKGTMDTGAMNQMVEAGIPIVKTLGEMFGKSGRQIYEMAEHGQITAAMVEKAFAKMSGKGGAFAGMMEKQSKTLSGIWGAITGQLAYAAGNIGEALLPVMKSVLSVFQDWANKIADMSADGSLITWFGRIAESGVSAIGEIIKWSITLTNHFAAAFRTIGAWGEVLWNGLKTGLLGLITLWVAQIEAMVNAAVAAYNTVVRFFGGQGKEISWTWTRATGETTAESARATADAYRRATDGGYFAEAMQDNQAWDRKIDSAVGRINEQIGKSVSSAAQEQQRRAANVNAKLPTGKTPDDVKGGGKAVRTEKIQVDNLAKIGLYNFSSSNIRSLDIERNNLLKQLVQKPAAGITVKEV